MLTTTHTDDEYEGKFLPKESTIFIGVWGLHHDKSYYKDPNTYDPERYNGYDKLASYYAGSPDYMKRDKYHPNHHSDVLPS